MQNNFEEGKYPKEQLEAICEWWDTHREYDINERADVVEIVLRPNWEKEKKERLRHERERSCFPVINRGTAWYARLTPEQNEELQAWYQAWLDAPDTGIMPETPSWV